MPYNYNLTESNPWLGFAIEHPQAMYQAFMPRGTTPFQDYWRSQYGNVYGNYMGQLGKMALRGQAPSTEFYDFLQGYPFLQQWYQQSPRARGEQAIPRLRWNV